MKMGKLLKCDIIEIAISTYKFSSLTMRIKHNSEIMRIKHNQFFLCVVAYIIRRNDADNTDTFMRGSIM